MTGTGTAGVGESAVDGGCEAGGDQDEPLQFRGSCSLAQATAEVGEELGES